MKYLFLVLSLATLLASCSSTPKKTWSEGEKINGFTLEKVVAVPEINGQAYFFVHDKTKSPLLYLSNDDNNKSFAVAFKTPPKDSTGVFHIFEHSVLSGSEKYPSKSLFFQVAGSSVNTFQNAMTFGDKTVYPVASTNAQDFKNLVGIYLDAVFFPKVVTNRKIFEREGWRYEIGKDGKPAYNGIVYSEMKGNYSSAETFLENETQFSLFAPTSAYHHDSGGDIIDISDLTYQELQATHKKFYNPSNSRIIFYGNGDIAQHLAMVNDGYLDKIAPNFEKIDISVDTPKTKMVRVAIGYPVQPGEKDLKNKVMFTRSYLLDSVLPARDYFGMLVYSTALGDFENSPLKKNLISKKICKDMRIEQDFIKKPRFTVVCHGSSKDKLQAFNKEVESTLANVQAHGLPKDLVESALNTVEFHFREYNTINRGLIASFRVLDSWLYDGNPLAYVRYAPELEWLRNERPAAWAQDFTKTHITGSAHQSLVSATPDVHMLSQIERKLSARLKKAEKTLGMTAIKKDFQEFSDWNKETVPVEVQNKVPKLNVADLDKTQKIIPIAVEDKNNIRYLKHEVPSQGIIYSNFYFDLNGIPEAWVPYLPMLEVALGKMDTKTMRYEDLDTKIHRLTGGMDFNIRLYRHKNDPNTYDARFFVAMKTLQPNFTEALALLKSVLLETKFDSNQRLGELFEQTYSSTESELGYAAGSYPGLNSMAKASAAGKFNNALDGYPQLLFLRAQNKNKDFAALNKKLAEISHALFQKKNLVVGLAYDPQNKETVLATLDSALTTLPSLPRSATQPKFEKQELFDGASFSGQVQFLSAYVQSDKWSENFGTMEALAQLTSSMFLLPALREQGGAYGGGMSVNNSGDLTYYTYRDPRLDESYKDLLKVPQFLRTFPEDQSLINNAILRTIGYMDHPFTAPEQVWVSDTYYFKGITPADQQKYRDQVFRLNTAEVRTLAKEVEDSVSKAQWSVVGQKSKLESSSWLHSKKLVNL